MIGRVRRVKAWSVRSPGGPRLARRLGFYTLSGLLTADPNGVTSSFILIPQQTLPDKEDFSSKSACVAVGRRASRVEVVYPDTVCEI